MENNTNIIRLNSLLGYEKTLSPMRAARVIETLEKRYRYDIFDDSMNEIKEVMTEAEFIIYALQEGRILEEYLNRPCSKCQVARCIDESACTKGKLTYHLKCEKYGTEISKTGYNFACWLIAEGLTTFDNIQMRFNLENAEKARAEQESKKTEQEKKEAAEAEEKAENEYKDWLYETHRNYGGIDTPEGEKIIIQRDIFLDIICISL